MPKTVTVSTAAQLTTAARAARAGDTILLAPGNYGDVSLNKLNPDGVITIRSADPDSDATFRSLRMINSSNMTFDDIDISRTLRPGESLNSNALQLTGSSHITFTGLDLRGSMDGNAWNDGNGAVITGGHHIAILNSTFEQLKTAVGVSADDFLFVGNTVTHVQEGVSINSMDRGVFEQNYMADWQANYAAGAHPDMFQVHSGGSTATASKNLIFRDNVLLPGAGSVGGIFIRSEAAGRGERHENILIENNYYEGANRNAISVATVDDLTIRNNTVLKGNNVGLVPAINFGDIKGGLIENNVSTMLLENWTAKNSGLKVSGNVDVWDEKFRKGFAVADLFGTRDAGDIDFTSLNVLATSQVNPGGAGFAAVADIGSLQGSGAIQATTWLSSYEQQFAVFI